MSGNLAVFAICFPVDLVYVGVAAWWVYRDAQLPNPDKSMRKLRRWVLVVTICVALWQLFVLTPWQQGKPMTHIPAELALGAMMLFGYWVGYLWVGDWCGYYFAKFHSPFPNAIYYAFGVASVVAGMAAALRSIVPFLVDDLWLYDLFFLVYLIPLIFGMACCVKLAWDVRSLTRSRYVQVLNDIEEDQQPLVQSKRRMHMCKVNFLLIYFLFGFAVSLYWIPTFIANLQEMKPGTPLHTRPEMPMGLVIGTAVSFWIPYAIVMWYSKFEWAADPLDWKKEGADVEGEQPASIGLDTMTVV